MLFRSFPRMQRFGSFARARQTPMECDVAFGERSEEALVKARQPFAAVEIRESQPELWRGNGLFGHEEV